MMNTNKSTRKTVCVCHKVTSARGKITPFTFVSWKTFQKAAIIWNDDIIHTTNYEYLKHDTPHGGYHRECHQSYANKEHLLREKKKRNMQKRQQPLISNEASPS